MDGDDGPRWIKGMSGGRWSAASLTLGCAGVIALSRGDWYAALFLIPAVVFAYATVAQIRRGRF